MQIVRESIFISGIRAFINTFLGMAGFLVALVLVIMIFGFTSSPYHTEDDLIEMHILPDANGETTPLPETAPVILQLNLSGIIGDTHTNASSLEAFLRMSRKGILKNNRVKALLLYIDTPGGTASDGNLIYQAITRYKELFKVPVYAYTPSICASAGYLIACSADKIYANMTSIVGSVGAKWGLGFNFWQFMQSHGIQSVTIAEGLYKEKYPTFTKLPETDAAYKDLIAIVEDGYTDFVNIVVKARKEAGLTEDLLRNTYGASVYTAATSQTHGYVDNGNATYMQTLTDLAKESHLETSPYQVICFEYKHSPLQDFVSNKFSLWIEEAQHALLGVKHQGKLNNKLLFYYEPQSSF